MHGHFDDCAEHLRPQLIMFLSVDVVGSTAFKQKFQNYGARADSDEREWFSVIQGFYIRTVQSFLSRWSGACADPKFAGSCGAAPLLWKTIGDEIVFRKAVGDYRQVAKTLRCWIEAMAEVRAFLQECDPQLDVKCTAWMGEFPVQNKIVIAPTHEVAQGLDARDLRTAGRILSERLGVRPAARSSWISSGPLSTSVSASPPARARESSSPASTSPSCSRSTSTAASNCSTTAWSASRGCSAASNIRFSGSI